MSDTDVQKLFRVEEVVPELYQQLLARKNTPELPITSMPQLNKKIWGLRRGKLTVIGARTSHGKSAFTLQVAKDIAAQGFNVLFLSLEMSTTDMVERMFCNMMEINNEDLMTGGFAKYTMQFTNWCGRIERMNLVFSDCLGKTWKEIDEILEKMSTKPDVVILDYIQAIKGVGVMDVGVLDEYIKKFREMSITYNYAGVIVSQINRSGVTTKEKNPQLHQLKGTGFMEEHADVVILLYWPHAVDEKEDPRKIWLNVAKNRNGRTGSVLLHYYGEFYLFKDGQTPKPMKEEEITEEVKRVKELFDGQIVEGQQWD